MRNDFWLDQNYHKKEMKHFLFLLNDFLFLFIFIFKLAKYKFKSTRIFGDTLLFDGNFVEGLKIFLKILVLGFYFLI